MRALGWLVASLVALLPLGCDGGSAPSAPDDTGAPARDAEPADVPVVDSARPGPDGGAPDVGGGCGGRVAAATDRPCADGPGVLVDACVAGEWTPGALCLRTAADARERGDDWVNVLGGYDAAEFEFGFEPDTRVDGWSHYLRAFDLVRDVPVAELGWGQWTSAGWRDDQVSVCGYHPHGFVCEDGVSDDPELAGCGSTDVDRMAECRFGCCGAEDRCGVAGTIEGGMGYWMYTLQAPRVKWMMPASTTMNYEIFGGTLIHDRPQPCTKLGGAVRLSNRLLVPNNFFSFDRGGAAYVDGFVGYMLSRTPIGRRSPDDEANHWTILIDTANYAGPALYIAPWFWESRARWHPDALSWADPSVPVGRISQGFEGKLGAVELVEPDGTRWWRTNRWALPIDRGDGPPRSTLFTAHATYGGDWAAAAMEPMLAGVGDPAARTPDAIRAAASAGRRTPRCAEPADQPVALERDEDDGERLWSVGVGSITPDEATGPAAQAAGCSMTLAPDPAEMDCADGWCEGPRFLRLSPDGARVALGPDDVPHHVRQALDLRRFEPTRRNDGRFLGPPGETEAACFDQPGPAAQDQRVYCSRTQDGIWIAWRWYRFVDQPELNQAFASLPADRREGARCYMQARIERLHAAQNAAGPTARWFEPQGELPAPRAALDPAFVLEPPAGLEVGFVPVPIAERVRSRPAICEVTIGAFEDEPDPLPAGYFDGYAEPGYGYDVEQCRPNAESGGAFGYPGAIYPALPVDLAPADGPHRYVVPPREAVGAALPEGSPMCGLPSDPPR